MKPCAAGLFCNFPVSSACGAAGVPGVCDNKPEACAEIYQPACGCDGETYANACEAQRAGMSVAQVSECWIEGKMCGGESGQTCDETEYCSYPFGDTCVHADAPGTCEVKARFCPEDIDLVCGCDNKTYANECKARQAGTNVAHAGACT